MDASSSYNRLEVVYRVYTIHKLRLHHYMVSVPIETSSSSLWATTVSLENESKTEIIIHSALPLGGQHKVCLDYKISPVADASGNFLQISSAFILWKQFESSFYKNIYWLLIIAVLKYSLSLDLGIARQLFLQYRSTSKIY